MTYNIKTKAKGVGQNSFEFVVTPACLACKITFVIFCVGAPTPSMTKTKKALSLSTFSVQSATANLQSSIIIFLFPRLITTKSYKYED